MEGNSTLVNIIMIVIVLHFVVGFVFLAKKLSGKPVEQEDDQNENTSS
jgi:competence protein ComGF